VVSLNLAHPVYTDKK